MIDNLSLYHRFEVSDDFDWTTMLCPICHFEYTHLEGVGADYEEGYKALCATLSFRCKLGHKFAVRVRNRKGQTLFWIGNVDLDHELGPTG